MAKRGKIGVIYSYNENWIGGTYYTLNLIHALNHIEDSAKPELVIMTDTELEYEGLVKATGYPYLAFRKLQYQLPLFKRACNKIARSIVRRPLFSDTVNFPVFPIFHVNPIFDNAPRKIYWIPDFQERHLPDFFTAEDFNSRVKWQSDISKANGLVVFSSNDAKKDYNQYYPDSRLKQVVLPFAVTHPVYQELNHSELLVKYKMPELYFFSPNQFWIHKNHIVILKAIKVLKEKGIKATVAFSGKEHDYRNPHYLDDLKQYVVDNDITNEVHFLGFIDRKDQLKLMSKALAVIQPSRCEGWSTVIEDAKAMNQYVLASGINVHKEQLKQNMDFFEPDDENTLAALMQNILQGKPAISLFDYSAHIKTFASSFLEMINVVNDNSANKHSKFL